MCELIQGQVQSHLFVARARKFKDCREAALFPNCIDPAVYDNLIAVIHDNLGLLHEYMHLRKELLGVDELHPYDLYVPLVEEAQTQMNYSDACQQVIDSVAPAWEMLTSKPFERDYWKTAGSIRLRISVSAAGPIPAAAMTACPIFS